MYAENDRLACGAAGSGERIQEGNSVRDLFMKAIYDQIWQKPQERRGHPGLQFLEFVPGAWR